MPCPLLMDRRPAHRDCEPSQGGAPIPGHLGRRAGNAHGESSRRGNAPDCDRRHCGAPNGVPAAIERAQGKADYRAPVDDELEGHQFIARAGGEPLRGELDRGTANMTCELCCLETRHRSPADRPEIEDFGAGRSVGATG